MSLRRWVTRVAPVACAAVLAACGGGGGGSSPAPAGSSNNLIATPSSTQPVQAIVGGSTTVTIAFTTDDGKPASAVQATNLPQLPTGWSASTPNFNCSQASTGNGCVLSLVYAPTTASSGTVSIGYSYTNNAGVVKTGTITIPYASTSHNNIVATSAPMGPIAVVAGASGTQAVNVYFNTDDGNPATNLKVTSSLTALPTGWSSSVAALNCASVTTGNGCVLPLTFKPSAATSGVLSIAYSYTDDSGAAKTGAIPLTYASTTHNHVVATAAPAGPVNAGVGLTSNVAITFATDDGNPASNVTITSGLTSLPTGWSATANSTPCAKVSTGNGCQLLLKYVPAAPATGTVTLNYSYLDDSGLSNSGLVSIPFTATVANAVQYTATPTGQVTAVLGSGGTPVTLTFTTNDGNSATNLLFTGTGLTALPVGWSVALPSTTGFACTTIGTGTGCQLHLLYAPTANGSGTLTLPYSYTSNSGIAGTASVSIPYAATTHNSVVFTATPSTTLAVPAGGTPQAVTITFNTNDVNTATALIVPALTLPAEWTSTTAFPYTCATVPAAGAASTCQISLLYTPVANSTDVNLQLQIKYTFTDNAGTTGATGNATLTYTATSDNVVATPSPATIAIVNPATQTVTVTFNTDDAHTATALSVPAPALPTGWTPTTTFPYTCATIAASGAASACSITLSYAPAANANASGTVSIGYSYVSNVGVAKSGSVTVAYASPAYAYIVDGGTPTAVGSNKVVQCTLGGGGALSGCVTAFPAVAIAGLDPRAIAFDNIAGVPTWAYISTRTGAGVVYRCAVTAGTGALTGCAADANTFNAPQGLAVNNGFLYVANTGNPVSLCPIDAGTGALSVCVNALNAGAFMTGGFASPAAIAFSGTDVYIADEFYDGSTNPVTSTGSVVHCTVSVADGTLSGCAVATAGAAIGHNNPDTLSIAGSTLFVGGPGGVSACTITGGGSSLSCTATGYTNDVHGLASANNFLFIGSQAGAAPGNLQVCTPTDSTATCNNGPATAVVTPEGITIN